MATNTILTPDMITKEALRILHEKLTFVGTINKQYDSSFAQSGAKIGDSLRIRKPAQYKVRTGATLSAQDHVETQVTLKVDNQVGVDIEFSADELTLSLDDFSKRVLDVAMAQLASYIEEDILKAAAGQSVVEAATPDFKDFLTAQAYLDNLATPRDNNRYVLIDTMMQVNLVDELKGLFQDSAEISKQYREGVIGKTAGATWAQSSRIPLTTTTATTDVFAIGSITGSSIAITGGDANEVIPAGTIFMLSNNATPASNTAYAVHPETKKTFTGQKVYVVTQAEVTLSGAGAGTIEVAAPIVSSGSDAKQNISAAPTHIAVVTEAKPRSLVYHKDFITFATADLVVPKGTDMASRENYDGISMRLVRDYDVTYDKFPCRLDVLYGKKVIRPEYGCTVIATA